jgi:hypothetical protein
MPSLRHRIDASFFDAPNANVKKWFGIVNWFLIENPASGRHVQAHPEPRLRYRVLCWVTLQKDIEETQGWAAEPSAQAMADSVRR